MTQNIAISFAEVWKVWVMMFNEKKESSFVF